MDSKYQKKYFKYKNKYLNLKNKIQTGGAEDKDKANLILFKAEWCGHCKAFKDTWESLKNDKEIKKKYVKMITYDSDANKDELKSWKIQGFPTLILQKNKRAYEYNGERSLEKIKSFVLEHL